jgi:hypothetical protein
MVTPYLPDIMQGVVERVSAAFQARFDDQFAVFFEKGNHPQVSRAVYQTDKTGTGHWPLVWLEMPEKITFGNWRIYGEAEIELYLVMPTDNKFTQQQRDDLSFKPRLTPIYEVLMQEMKRERWFQTGYGPIQHSRMLLPFWGFGAVNGVDVKGGNMMGKNVDAIRIRIPKIAIKRQNCGSASYSINPNTDYTPSPYILAFFDDIEIIVGGGGPYDPADQEVSLGITALQGKDYDVYDRGLGQLRKARQAEIIKDVSGGFTFTGGKKFLNGETYIIKVRPQYVENTGGATGTQKSGLTSFFIENN